MDKIRIYILLAIVLVAVDITSANEQGDDSDDRSEYQEDDSDCSLELFLGKEKEVDSISLNYLQSQKEQLIVKDYLECKSKLVKKGLVKLKDAMSKISDEDKKIVEKLAYNVVEDGILYNDEDDIDFKKVKDGVAEFVNKQIDIMFANQGEVPLNLFGKKGIISEVKEKIEDACKRAYDKMEKAIEIFDVVGDRGELTYDIDRNIKEWLTRGRVCRLIIGSSYMIETICENAYISKQLATHPRESELNEEWTNIRVKAFARRDEGSEISPVDLLEYLKRMDEIYSELNPLGLINRDDRWEGGVLKELIEFGNVNEAKCDREIFLDFRNTKLINKSHPKTIIPYLKYFSSKQYTVCEAILNSKLAQTISELTALQKKDISELNIEKFGEDYTRFHPTPDESLIKGSLNFLKSRAKLNRKSTKEEIEQAYKQNLESSCEIVTTKFKDVVEAYQAILINKDLKQLVDPKASEWSYRYETCRTLAHYRPAIIEGIQRQLKGCHGGSKFCGLL